MSLFSQGSIKKSPIIYVYLLLGGLGGLLMFFLIRHSLPLDQQQLREYHQDIQAAKQDIFNLETAIFQSRHQNYKKEDNKLDFQLGKTLKSLENLEQVPAFFNPQEKSILTSKLETQEVLLTSQIGLIRQLEDINLDLHNSCQYIYKLNQEFRNGVSQSSKALSPLENSLLVNGISYCYEENSNTGLTIQSQLKELDILLKEELKRPSFSSMSLIEQNNKILINRQKINKINRQLEIFSLHEKIMEFEDLYLDNIDSLNYKTQVYRFISYLLLLATVIFIAYKIISNLTQTNRNIVKILEGFTQELETKVEQRTALLEESIQNTETALAQAQNANKAKSRFLANMSHELRTPLNAILGFTQLMCRDSSISKEHQENIQIINRSGEHLLKLINDILEMSKIEVGQITLNEVRFDLYTMLKSIEEMLRLKAEVKKIELNFDVAKNVPKQICTDEGKLRQIIINLLGNALKFTQKGAITLRVELKDNLELEEANIEFLFTDTHLLHFAVMDTGPGIPPDEMDSIVFSV